MKTRAVPTDLVAGLAGVAVLVLCAAALSISLPVSLLLAAATYLGVRLAFPSLRGRAQAGRPSMPPAQALTLAMEKVEEIGRLARQLPPERATGRALIEGIHTRAARILGVIQQDPDKQQAAPQYLERYLTPIGDVVTRYARLSARRLASAAVPLDEADADALPKIEASLDELYEQLHSGDIVSFLVDSRTVDLHFLPIELSAGESER